MAIHLFSMPMTFSLTMRTITNRLFSTQFLSAFTCQQLKPSTDISFCFSEENSKILARNYSDFEE